MDLGCIPDPVCQGSLLSLSGPGGVLVTSGPASSNARRDLQLHVSRDHGASFSPIGVIAIDEVGTDYSDLVELGSELGSWTIGVAYSAMAGVGWTSFELAQPQ